MKTIFISFMFAFFGLSTFYSQVGIGTPTPDPSAILDVTSLTKGFLPPRMTDAERDAIVSTASGLVIYNTTVKCMQWYSGTVWYNGCTGTVPAPSVLFTAKAPVYNGLSVINSQGVAYNGEVTPPAATIVVEVNVLSLPSSNWSLSVNDPASGLAYSGTGTFTTTGIQTITLSPGSATINPLEIGIKRMVLSGLVFINTKVIEPRIDLKSIPASATAIVNVTHGTQTWMDRNLGARRAATSRTDALSYGSNYQWGRPADGHEITVISTAFPIDGGADGRGFYDATALNDRALTDIPGHPNFIRVTTSPPDWRSDNNNNRWYTANQGPCPAGYRVPTFADWDLADTFGAWGNYTDGFNSPLKLPSSGFRNSTGRMAALSVLGDYWSSTIDLVLSPNNSESWRLNVSSAARSFGFVRSSGFAVRCIKN